MKSGVLDGTIIKWHRTIQTCFPAVFFASVQPGHFTIEMSVQRMLLCVYFRRSTDSIHTFKQVFIICQMIDFRLVVKFYHNFNEIILPNKKKAMLDQSTFNLLSYNMRHIHRAHYYRSLVTITAAGANQSVFPCKIQVVCSSCPVMPRVPAFHTVDIF